MKKLLFITLLLLSPFCWSQSIYEDFDSYMIKLDPVAGYLKGKFGAEKAHSLVHDFLFEYGTD